MKVFRPLQVSFNHRVLEQNRKFYFIASASLGINLQTGEELLEFDYFKDAFECMGENPLPDVGMPKPNGEYLVSGSFHSPGNQPVNGGEVIVRIGEIEKSLFVFGPRQWRLGAPAKHETLTSLPIDYCYAFGGEGYDKNPHGIGYKDGKLPGIEEPRKLVTSPNDRPEPAGFGPLDPARPQRRRFQGTYGDDYKRKYFPGHPEDFSWRYFLCAPEDQWIKGYFRGNEPFAITNMHPELQVISGTLPGLHARCFIRHTLSGSAPEFGELEMNLDTIWFFPEKLLALLIWRKGIEVGDDEAEQITHVLAAYEDRAQEPRTLDHYRQALELRLNTDDDLLHNLKTADLIPVGAKTAMELLLEMGKGESEESELEKNIDAKIDSFNKMVDEKMEEAIEQTEKGMEDLNIPDEAREHMPDGGEIDLRKMIKEQPEAEPDPDVEALNKKLESIIPGITTGDPDKIDLREFSFDDIDQMIEAVEGFSDKKQAQAMELANSEIAKTKEQIISVLAENKDAMDKVPDEHKAKLEETLKALEELDLETTPDAPLPRVNAEEFIGHISQASPQVMEAMQHLQAAREMGLEDERTGDLEKQVKETMETQMKEVEEGLRDAEAAFKETYVMVAHHMDEGLSPHKDPVERVAERLLADVANGRDVSGGDWACIDLSGKNLDGVDLSGAFLEQVNFKGASLKVANLSGAVLARSDLADADLTGANLAETNLGAVNAHRTNFTGADLKSAVISKGDFTGADFTRCELEDVESLEVIISGANFSEAHMPGIQFIESEFSGANFTKADLSSTLYYSCAINDADFSKAIMSGSTFADARLEKVRFDGADMSGACFAATDPEKASMKDVSFRGSILKQANFQGMAMQGSDLSGADLENSNFLEADLTEADLTMAQAKSAMFRKARLQGAKLNSINLMEGCLAKAYLVEASFVNANLYAADFLRATITRTDFRGSNLDNTIIEGWRPE
jgi:uncharacterized protein YjbI with pentapeptide repeats